MSHTLQDPSQRSSARPVNHGLRHLPMNLLWALLLGIQQWRDQHRKYKRTIDTPRLADGILLKEITFYSQALSRETTYRVFVPANIAPGTHLPVVYLLHAAGDDFRGWSNDSNVAQFAHGLILVMPSGNLSHFVNPVDGPRELYADFISNDLRIDVEQRFPASTSRNHRAIVGLSMGGFGAIHLALAHPDLYTFAAGISSAFDVVTMPFSLLRLPRWLMLRRVFGPLGSQPHNQRNPFVQLLACDPKTTPYFYLACGATDHLLPGNQQFVELLQQHQFQHTFRTIPGDHDWDQWNAEVPLLFQSLRKYLGR